jgi:glycosyltransferase involved in cell wall biosynthesis
MRVLTLVALGRALPGLEELKRLEKDDLIPRASLYQERLRADLLDERFINLNAYRLPSWAKRLPARAQQLFLAYRLCREYDAVVSWAEFQGIFFALILKMARIGVPHVALFSWISKPKKALLLRFVSTHIDRMVLWCSSQYAFAVKRLGVPERKVVFTRWSVDQEFWRPFGRETDMICAAGREMRDYGTLVSALQGINVRCHIATRTEPGKRDSWMSLFGGPGEFPEHITVGTMNSRDLRELYARSRFVVMPLLASDTDNGISTILEAMAMGKAIICTRTLGQTDAVVENVTGLYVPQGDPRALREAIVSLWENPRRAQEMGAEGRRRIEQYHRVEQFVDTVKSVVEDAIRARQAAVKNHSNAKGNVLNEA